MLQNNCEEYLKLVPKHTLKKITNNRPKKYKEKIKTKIKTNNDIEFNFPNISKKIERFLKLHQSYVSLKRPYKKNSGNVLKTDLSYPLDPTFPFDDFYNLKGKFNYTLAEDVLKLLFSNQNISHHNLLIHLFIESLWKKDKIWISILEKKMNYYKINNFRSPMAILSAIRINEKEIADKLIEFSDVGGLREVAQYFVEENNFEYLEKIMPLLNISSSNDLFFQTLSRNYKSSKYTKTWEYLSKWSNPYKVINKLLYMRDCGPADYLLSNNYIPFSIVEDSWRYVEKAGLEELMPETNSRIIKNTLLNELNDILISKENNICNCICHKELSLISFNCSNLSENIVQGKCICNCHNSNSGRKKRKM